MSTPPEVHRLTGPHDEPVGDHFMDRFVLPMLTEPPLWPVSFAIVGHVVVVLALPLVSAWRSGSGAAWALVFALAALTGVPIVLEHGRGGRWGLIAGLVALTWVLTLIVAGITGHYGVF